MNEHTIAIIGLGRTGTLFLEQILKKGEELGVQLLCVVEVADTEGRRLAIEKGIEVVSLEALVALGVKVDVIFDLTGSREVRQKLEAMLESFCNKYTAIADSNITRLVWSLMSEDYLPDVHVSKSQAIADTLLDQAWAGVIK